MAVDETVSSVTRRTIEAYFDGFNARDLSRMPIADNVYFKAPVNPELVVGLDALRPFLENVFSQFDRIVVQRTIVEGEFACVMLVSTAE